MKKHVPVETLFQDQTEFFDLSASASYSHCQAVEYVASVGTGVLQVLENKRSDSIKVNHDLKKLLLLAFCLESVLNGAPKDETDGWRGTPYGLLFGIYKNGLIDKMNRGFARYTKIGRDRSNFILQMEGAKGYLDAVYAPESANSAYVRIRKDLESGGAWYRGLDLARKSDGLVSRWSSYPFSDPNPEWSIRMAIVSKAGIGFHEFDSKKVPFQSDTGVAAKMVEETHLELIKRFIEKWSSLWYMSRIFDRIWENSWMAMNIWAPKGSEAGTSKFNSEYVRLRGRNLDELRLLDASGRLMDDYPKSDRELAKAAITSELRKEGVYIHGFTLNKVAHDWIRFGPSDSRIEELVKKYPALAQAIESLRGFNIGISTRSRELAELYESLEMRLEKKWDIPA